MPTLYELGNEFKAVIEALDFGCDPETGEVLEDDSGLRETLQGLEMALEDKIKNIGCLIKNLDSEAEAIHFEREKLAKREKQKAGQVERLKRYVSEFWPEGVKAIEDPRVRLSWRKCPASVEIDSMDDIPGEFVRIKTEYQPIKSDLKKYLEEGNEIAGVRLVTDRQNLKIE